MRCFWEWLLNEVSASPVQWKKEEEVWKGLFSVGNIQFEVTFWKNWPTSGNWKACFYQAINGKGNTSGDDQPVGFQELIGLFQTLDQSILELMESDPRFQSMTIHPELVSDKRIKKFGGKGLFGGSHEFDLGKFNAYQQMFNYSQMKRMGCIMRIEGENIVIEKPALQKVA